MRRTIKLFSMAAMAALALSAFVASAASAGHTWEVNGVNLAAGATQTCQATSDGTMTLKSEVLTGSFHLTGTTVSTTGCELVQSGSGATAVAEDRATTINFGGLTVDEPVGCKVNSPISTTAVKSKIITVGGVAYTTFLPSSGTKFADIVVKECAAAETYPVRGTTCVEMPQAGVLKAEQTIKASEVADKACPEDKLTLGGKAAILRGGIILELTGANAGKAWGFTAT